MIDDKGHIMHIDFGFIFDISPGHNMRFESANFKLTREMIQIMGGSKDSEPFQHYMNLTIKAFLACRKYHEHIYNIIRLMTGSSLPCFRTNSMKNLINRFKLKMNDYEAAQHMKSIIFDAYDKLTTRLYDDIQYL
jgi:phosphatidylinositol 4-kinase